MILNLNNDRNPREGGEIRRGGRHSKRRKGIKCRSDCELKGDRDEVILNIY